MLLSMLVLIVALWVVFFGGLAPSDRSEANRPELVVPSLQVNQFAWLSNPTATEQWPSQILALRDASGALHTWEIPMRDTHYLMPNDKWLNASWPCVDFRPDPSKQVIACWDQDLHAWGKENYQWDFSGKNIRGVVEDLLPPYAWIKLKLK